MTHKRSIKGRRSRDNTWERLRCLREIAVEMLNLVNIVTAIYMIAISNMTVRTVRSPHAYIDLSQCVLRGGVATSRNAMRRRCVAMVMAIVCKPTMVVLRRVRSHRGRTVWPIYARELILIHAPSFIKIALAFHNMVRGMLKSLVLFVRLHVFASLCIQLLSGSETAAATFTAARACLL